MSITSDNLKIIEKYRDLIELSKFLAGERNIYSLLDIIMQRTTQLLEADRSSLFIVDSEKNEVWSIIAQEVDFKEIRVPLDKGIVGYTARTGEIVNIKDAYSDSRFYRDVDAKTGYRTRSILSCPVKNSEGRVIGVIESLNKKTPPHYFTKEDEEVICIISSLASVAIESAFARQSLIDENISLRKLLQHAYEPVIVGKSNKIKSILSLIKKVAPTSATVLIRGESGTGKELIARTIHKFSKRACGPFVKISCAAIPETLLESELFGHEKGAFTGAETSRKGCFELANGGTLFLDEIGDISPPVQVKLLRAIQEKEIQKIGSSKPVKVDVRIIAATNKNIEEMIKKGEFREDLYYRLNVISITMPPLRERKEDIPLLVNHIIKKLNIEMNRKFTGVEEEALQYLLSYHWPGNVRELENTLERAMVLGTEPYITKKDIGPFPWSEENDEVVEDSHDLKSKIEMLEKREISRVLQRVNFNVSAASKLLNIKRTTLFYKMKKYGLHNNSLTKR